MKKQVAIVLAAGSGKRMGGTVKKQYLLLEGKPILYYSLKALEESFIDEIILVTSAEEIEYCKKEIVEAYGFQKVVAIVEGGKERYHSVFAGLNYIKECCPGAEVVYIHDGARPFLDHPLLCRLKESVEVNGNGVAAVPVKDTIKMVDENNFVTNTPRRDQLWQVQTPQVFRLDEIFSAYSKMIEKEKSLQEQNILITDDAMVAELILSIKVKLIEGSYSNIKITTKEDILAAEQILFSRKI